MFPSIRVSKFSLVFEVALEQLLKTNSPDYWRYLSVAVCCAVAFYASGFSLTLADP